MAKATYELTCPASNVKIVDGVAVITFEREVDDDDLSNAEASGEYQSNMLWECFGHSFEGCYDNGDLIMYNEDGEITE